MSDGRTHYADDETIAYIAKLEAERDELIQERDAWQDRADKLADALEMITTFDPSDGQCDNGYPPQDEARIALDAYRSKA